MSEYTKILQNPKDYRINAIKRTQEQAEIARNSILLNPKFWGKSQSVRDFYKDCFDNSLGAIKLRENEISTAFFRDDTHKYIGKECFKNRGRSYFIALDPLRNKVNEKLDVIKKDITCTLSSTIYIFY
jgi:hypothetical protein